MLSLVCHEFRELRVQTDVWPHEVSVGPSLEGQPDERRQILQLRISKTYSGEMAQKAKRVCPAGMGTQVQIPSTHRGTGCELGL